MAVFTVGALIAQLQTLDPFIEVYIASDDECNDVRGMWQTPDVVYFAKSRYEKIILSDMEEWEDDMPDKEEFRKVCLL